MASLKTNKNFKVAVKTISKEKVNVDFDSIKKELEIMRSLDHPNIIKFYGTY
jgi:calcium-dependent protein kinase